jgi:hypothetical protein
MKLNERDIRRIIKQSLEEMALKSMQVGMPRLMPPDRTNRFFMSPEERAEQAAQYLADMQRSYEAGEISFDPSGPGFEERVWSPEESYKGAMKTWGRKSYESYAKRQFERIPLDINVFVIPQSDRETPARRFTEPNDVSANEAGMEIILHHFPDAVIKPEDFNLVILMPNYSVIRGDRPEHDENPVLPPKSFLEGDGLYNSFHAFFDAGIFGEIADDIREPVEAIISMLAGSLAGSAGVHKLIRMGDKSPLAKIFRMKTLRNNRLTDVTEIPPELCTVALVRNAIPVNVGNFPASDVEGRQFTQEEIDYGNDLLQEISFGLEPAKEAYMDLIGKTVIGSPENVP